MRRELSSLIPSPFSRRILRQKHSTGLCLARRKTEQIALTEKEVAVLEDEIEQLVVEHGGDIRRGYIAEGADKAATDSPPVPRASRAGFSRISYLQCSLGFCRGGSRRIG